jgi:hypothetical protein
VSARRTLFVAVALALVLPLRAAIAQDGRAAIEPGVSATRDSDGNLGLRLNFLFDVPAGPGTTLGLEGTRWQVEDGIDRIRSYGLAGRLSFHSGNVVRGEAAVGGTIVDPSGLLARETVLPTGRFRIRAAAPSGLALEVRARRGVLDASPDLMANLVVRNEAGVTVDIPLAGMLKLRGTGRVTGLEDRLDRNLRTAAAGMVVLAVTPAVELSGQFHSIAYDHFSTAGYFAPRLVQIAQLGSYGELEAGVVSLAYDVGAGVQRLAAGPFPLGPWRGAASLWSQLGFRVATGTRLRVELEFYDSPAAALAAGPGWKYVAAGVSLRQSF